MSVFVKFAIIISFIVISITISIFVTLYSCWKVASDAARIAGSQPYCIQVADRRTADYKPALSWYELSVLSMRATRDGLTSLQHHAILAVGDATTPKLYHWSYRQAAFQEGVGYGVKGPALTCLPKHNFVGNLPKIWHYPVKYNYVRFSPDEAYLIPVAWRADWSGGESRSLALATAAPEFQPSAVGTTAMHRDANQIFVTWTPEWVNSLINSRFGDEVTSRSLYEGLVKTTHVTIGSNGIRYNNEHYIFKEEKDLDNITIISCYEASGKFSASCQHRFVNRGRHFYFRHAPAEVQNWRTMQRRVLDLMASFEVPSTSR